METAVVGETTLRECPKCAGVWVDTASLERIYAEREPQAAVLGMALPSVADSGGRLEQVRYLPCPECGKLMNRVNFSGYSSVIVDVCKSHGTWFDRDELRRVIEFIRSGGLELARRSELSELEARQRELKVAKLTLPGDSRINSRDFVALHHSGINLIAGALSSMFGKDSD
jgi:Zn-finger nucleic acid-binding protein